MSKFSALRNIPFMGVIDVVHEASKLGFWNGNPDWSNMGQGQPEIGPIEGAPPRLDRVTIAPQDCAYGPINGIDELRDAVAALYNRLFRQGKSSQYSRENVAIANGGRLMLSRAFSIIGQVPLGYQTPDYTAYEEMLDYHRHRFVPVHCAAHEDSGFMIPPERFASLVKDHGLSAFCFSNPCNPTGQVIEKEALASYIDTCRSADCLLISDEFYSHFIFDKDGGPGNGPVSAAALIDDVDRDPVLILDGLTKNLRYPGLRLGWAVGPREVIDTIGRAASAIDGGPSLAAQRFALAALAQDQFDEEVKAVREVFARKRKIMLATLQEMGVRFPFAGQGTFYLWGDVSALPEGLNSGEKLYRAALKERVMLVPGAYFDVNPGKCRHSAPRFDSWVRFSFGPPEHNMIAGLERLRVLVDKHR